MVICPVCKEPVDLLTKAHIASHGLTRDDFLRQHPVLNDKAVWGTLLNADGTHGVVAPWSQLGVEPVKQAHRGWKRGIG